MAADHLCQSHVACFDGYNDQLLGSQLQQNRQGRQQAKPLGRKTTMAKYQKQKSNISYSITGSVEEGEENDDKNQSLSEED